MMLRFLAIVSSLLVVFLVAACGDTPTTEAPTVAPTAVPASESSEASTTGTNNGKVSANDATEEELIAAFEAAGIENASQWAHEVEEYRPYPADDPEFTKLRQDLAKYNPGPGVLEAIIALLELP